MATTAEQAITSSDNRQDHVAIIGAGPAGLCAARALKRAGIPFEIFERHSDVGGIWDSANPGSPMYESAHFIASKGQCHFAGLPMPDHFPDYPSHRQILEYIRQFADAYGLRELIRFNTAVKRIQPIDDSDRHWVVETDDGRRATYRAVICANGETWDPIMPERPGDFAGEIRHSVSYQSPDEFRNRRVLIIGAGNSGCDIACDAALNADAAYISMRRGYHFVPKHVFGLPADEFADRGPDLPMWLERPVFSAILRMYTGDLTRLGLKKPDHKIFESHPILNTQLLHYLAHGDIEARGDVERYDGHTVYFTDGEPVDVDLIICATGYYKSIPYADRDLFDWKGSSPDLYLNVFNRRHDNLFGMSFIETNSGAYQVFDLMATLLAGYLSDQDQRPEYAARFRERVRTSQEDLSGGIRFVDSERHHIYVNSRTFQKHLRKVIREMQWPEISAETSTPEQIRETVKVQRSA